MEKILSELVIMVMEHFGLEPDTALAAVAQSKVANELTSHNNRDNLTVDQLASQLFEEIANAE